MLGLHQELHIQNLHNLDYRDDLPWYAIKLHDAL